MKDGKINVLIFPCESNSNELHDALSYCFNVNVYGASSVQRHGKFIYKNYNCEMPYVTSPDFINVFNKYIDDNLIDLIFPTHDTISLFLAEHADQLHAKPVQGDVETNQICRSKIKTHTLFKDCDFAPVRYKSIEEIVYPVFVKPDEGEGAHGAYMCKSEECLKHIDFSKNIITEFLPGKEYTIDCFTDKNGKLCYISPRTRDRIWGGMAVESHSVELSYEIENIAQTINQRLKFLGLWYFQLREDVKGKLKLMEISVRCAGTMCMTRAKGVNLPLLTVYAAMGYDTNVYDNNISIKMDRSLIGRYDLNIEYDTVYIDFDDTITLRGNVNPLAMYFLYQCHNKNIKVFLLTRHIDNIHDSLAKYAISESLFTSIILVSDEAQKSQYITEPKSIFIDNMFKERTVVHNSLGIPVFDADAFEFLLDWKV